MTVTFHISFYEPWQGALMKGKVERFVTDIAEANKMRKEYIKHYQQQYGADAIVNYTIKD